MAANDPFSNLPDDPEIAFIELEKQFRAELNEKLENSESGSAGDSYYLEYINRTLASARALKLDILREWEVPSHENNLWSEFRRFSTDVDHYLIQIKILHGRRNREYSVGLDAPTKQKIRHHLSQIKEAIDPLGLPQAKKETLYAKINALADEVDRDRTRFEKWASLSIEMATTVGEVAQLARVRELIDSVAKLLGFAKDAENSRPSLPPPHEAKRLAPPRRQLSPPEKRPSKVKDLDDEIPF